eukprot:7562091-Lingulodinium_polyedra.AAC.1
MACGKSWPGRANPPPATCYFAAAKPKIALAARVTLPTPFLLMGGYRYPSNFMTRNWNAATRKRSGRPRAP